MATDTDIEATPPEVFQRIEEDGKQAGGAWSRPPEYNGSVGVTMFDSGSSEDGTVTVLLPRDSIDALPTQALVRINSLPDKREYLAAVVAGPFAEPDGLSADATPIIASTVRGGLLMPPFHGRGQLALIGERLKTGTIVPPRRRPKPNSPVFVLDKAETTAVLRLGGDVCLGLADGFDDLEVRIPSNSKSVLPRHLGILGTTGGGKSTTVSGLVAQLQQREVAVVLIDTEGEYCAIHEPTDNPVMREALDRRGQKPTGVPNTHVLHLVGRETANPNHPSVTKFSLRYSDLSPYAVQEILELTEPQEQRFMKAFDITKRAMEQCAIWPRNAVEKAQLLELDEMEEGYPKMALDHLYDVVQFIAASENDEPDAGFWGSEFKAKSGQIKKLITDSKPPKSVPSWRALQGKLGKLRRLNVFDSTSAPSLNFVEMLQPGRVTIIDLSDTDSPQINNLVIADLLRGIQKQQEANYRAAAKAGKSPTPTMVFIEEAHEFLSAHRIKQMPVLFQQVARIARRGRKRWLGLSFVTQLPQHLPDEVLGLINNWILHKISDSNVISRLQRSIGGIEQSMWRHMPSLAAGQAICSFTSHARPVQAAIDPTPCRLLMTQ
ncbi:MAG TPA: ATP-binding protein [Tepidisphaeraceae bacterium]|nr:ATP-binding protein [Tepidisphaeraceae bacterium]